MKLWIAKDKDGNTWLYKTEPTLNKELNMYDGILFTNFSVGDFFPEVTFENSPQEVELKLVSEIVGVVESPSKTFPRVNDFEVGASYSR